MVDLVAPSSPFLLFSSSPFLRFSVSPVQSPSFVRLSFLRFTIQREERALLLHITLLTSFSGGVSSSGVVATWCGVVPCGLLSEKPGTRSHAKQEKRNITILATSPERSFDSEYSRS